MILHPAKNNLDSETSGSDALPQKSLIKTTRSNALFIVLLISGLNYLCPAVQAESRPTLFKLKDAPATGQMTARELPPGSFLATVRRAFEEKVWGEFSGQVQHRSPRARISTRIELAVQIEAPDFMRARIVIHDDAVYETTHRIKNGEPIIHVQQPSEKTEVTLEELGLKTEDLIFNFLYWDLVKEKEPEPVRGQPCRVLRLREPDSERQIQAWFSREHLAPLKILWFEKNGKTPERKLEMTDFESRRGVWYVKSFRLTGHDWQTRVRFSEGALYKHENRTPPDDLFPDD